MLARRLLVGVTTKNSALLMEVIAFGHSVKLTEVYFCLCLFELEAISKVARVYFRQRLADQVRELCAASSVFPSSRFHEHLPRESSLSLSLVLFLGLDRGAAAVLDPDWIDARNWIHSARVLMKITCHCV